MSITFLFRKKEKEEKELVEQKHSSQDSQLKKQERFLLHLERCRSHTSYSGVGYLISEGKGDFEDNILIQKTKTKERENQLNRSTRPSLKKKRFLLHLERCRSHTSYRCPVTSFHGQIVPQYSLNFSRVFKLRAQTRACIPRYLSQEAKKARLTQSLH